MAIISVFELFDLIGTQTDLHINATDIDGTTQSLITSNDAKSFVLHKYGTRRYKTLRGGAAAVVEEAAADFQTDFTNYIKNRQHGIDRMYQAMYDQEYSPIENVFADEKETTTTDDDLTHGLSTSTTGSDTTTYNTNDAKTGNDKIEHSGDDTTTHSRAGFNSGDTYTPDSKDKIDYASNDKTIYASQNAKTGTETLGHNTTVANSGKDQRDIKTIREFTRHGNVGVTSSQELINQELELYVKSLAEMLLSNFVDEFTFYS